MNEELGKAAIDALSVGLEQLEKAAKKVLNNDRLSLPKKQENIRKLLREYDRIKHLLNDYLKGGCQNSRASLPATRNRQAV